MKKLILILTVLVVANVTYAQIPPATDAINIYFDLSDYTTDIIAPLYSIVPCCW